MGDHADANAPTLQGKILRLDPVTRNDTPFLYALAVEHALNFRWRYRGIPTLEVFERELWQGVLAQFVVRSARGENAGLVVCYNPELHSGYAYLAMAFSEKYVKTGLPIEAGVIFLSYLFATWNLRKVYIESLELVYKTSFPTGEGTYFHEEARLRDHEWWNGRYWDKFILAVYRDDPFPRTI